MADSNKLARVKYAATIAHMKCVLLPDGKAPKFKYLRPEIRKGISYGVFEWHPELWTEVKRFCKEHDEQREIHRSRIRKPALRMPLLAEGD